jgi:succinate dehydrogenase/fumarate reductase cytochrome b subunit
MSRVATLPRNTTRQAEGPLYGDVARVLHRVSGGIVILFVLVHVVVQMVRHVPAFAAVNAAAPWLEPLQHIAAIHALLYASVAFHTLYGLRLLAGEAGFRLPYRASLWTIGVLSLVPAVVEISRHG